MQPRNELERDMLARARRLPPVTDRQRAYAYSHCFEPLAVYRRRRRTVSCMCCGYTTQYDKPFLESFIDVDQYDCPECGRSMRLTEHFRELSYLAEKCFTVLTTFEGYQVARTYLATRDNRTKGQADYGLDEIYQTWLLADGREVVTGHRLHRTPYSEVWDLSRPIDIRQHNASCTGQIAYADAYDLAGNYFYPEARVTPLLRRNGWTRELMRFSGAISMIDAMRWLLMVPTAEMLVKTGQHDLFYNMVRRGQTELPHLHSVRIANRRGYVVHDAQMWLDMLRMADELGMDTHSPTVVCPPDLRAAHDAILERVARRLRKQQAEENRRRAEKDEAAYRRSKGRYFGISFGDDDITISVLTSVADIAAEGDAMHHCVFQAEYYKKPTSLILSARDRDGRRLETIEVNLRTFAVEQSRAVCNRSSPRHDEILDLMRANMHRIRAAAAMKNVTDVG